MMAASSSSADATSRLWVKRLKNGLSVEQPIPGDELRAVKRYLRQRDSKLSWPFLSERGQELEVE